MSVLSNWNFVIHIILLGINTIFNQKLRPKCLEYLSFKHESFRVHLHLYYGFRTNDHFIYCIFITDAWFDEKNNKYGKYSL